MSHQEVSSVYQWVPIPLRTIFLFLHFISRFTLSIYFLFLFVIFYDFLLFSLSFLSSFLPSFPPSILFVYSFFCISSHLHIFPSPFFSSLSFFLYLFLRHTPLSLSQLFTWLRFCFTIKFYRILLKILRGDGDRKQHILFKPPNYY